MQRIDLSANQAINSLWHVDQRQINSGVRIGDQKLETIQGFRSCPTGLTDKVLKIGESVLKSTSKK